MRNSLLLLGGRPSGGGRVRIECQICIWRNKSKQPNIRCVSVLFCLLAAYVCLVLKMFVRHIYGGCYLYCDCELVSDAPFLVRTHLASTPIYINMLHLHETGGRAR